MAEAASCRERQKINSTDSKIRSTPNPHLYIPYPTFLTFLPSSPILTAAILFYPSPLGRATSLPLVLDRRVPRPAAFRDPSPRSSAGPDSTLLLSASRLSSPELPRDERNSILSFRITIYNEVGREGEGGGGYSRIPRRRCVSPAGRSGLIKRCTGDRAPRAIASRDLRRSRAMSFRVVHHHHRPRCRIYIRNEGGEGKEKRESRKRRR